MYKSTQILLAYKLIKNKVKSSTIIYIYIYKISQYIINKLKMLIYCISK